MPHKFTFCQYYLPSSSLFYFISFEPRELLRRMVSSAKLHSVSTNLFRFGGPCVLVFGCVGNIANLVVFTQQSLRKISCSICFVAINLPATSISACRWFYYVGYVLTCSSASYVIVAAIDRILITSSNARTRQRSTRRHVLTWIIGITIVWMLFHIHALAYMRILQYVPGFVVCSYQPGTYTTFITYCTLLFIFFGLRTTNSSEFYSWILFSMLSLCQQAPCSLTISKSLNMRTRRLSKSRMKDTWPPSGIFSTTSHPVLVATPI